jgi:predicted small metal-binding protein
MKSFACGAVHPGCTATFRADSTHEILAMVAHHSRHDHGLTEISVELVDRVRGNIHTAA